ncbi:1-deoxy-D-xylulose-5-phosphate reductoisomerase [Effusibacillus lacus]|uniref:1-deoxy-D-xylulose 5-phosphate reductoisomerase n=1 Tax=Effusibacillus lacus TaxID=1348429 RepID=A0A292YNR9_9BACL|nr:1-deoxy-D-xylulose-5-phosphate reductoisomerase [Effusibacillus lacus]TCS73156.1 1-deoxy-D-xylulose 5-phosphate reductoisomerase [Effusibacillus lacus]GAX90559.1 1-deoxy-D-xylulose-5-phosphate reductoisomerase [Effusibacillus lacus]
MTKKKLAILGSTGSIGIQTLDVVASLPEQFEVIALAAGSNLPVLFEQIDRFQPAIVSVATPELAVQVKERYGTRLQVEAGHTGLQTVATVSEADLVVTAVVGTVGLRPTLAAVSAGKDIALANKETLVAAGHLVTELAAGRGTRILPVDSEHSAIFQCMHGGKASEVRRILLTASGGSFRDKTREEMARATREDALAHPNWSMGAKITVDSATLMNKGLEVIEAHWLFGIPYDRIEVLIHPQSIIHSLVEFQDRSVLAQLGTPDMRVPIQYALSYPDRLEANWPSLDLLKVGTLTFLEPDLVRFPVLGLAYEAGRTGGSMPAVLNAANEAAVELFLQGKIGFLDIERILMSVMEQHTPVSKPDLEEILHLDEWARLAAYRLAVQ